MKFGEVVTNQNLFEFLSNFFPKFYFKARSHMTIGMTTGLQIIWPLIG